MNRYKCVFCRHSCYEGSGQGECLIDIKQEDDVVIHGPALDEDSVACIRYEEKTYLQVYAVNINATDCPIMIMHSDCLNGTQINKLFGVESRAWNLISLIDDSDNGWFYKGSEKYALLKYIFDNFDDDLIPQIH